MYYINLNVYVCDSVYMYVCICGRVCECIWLCVYVSGVFARHALVHFLCVFECVTEASLRLMHLPYFSPPFPHPFFAFLISLQEKHTNLKQI